MEVMTRQRQLLIRAGMLDMMLALCQAQVALSTDAAFRIGHAWNAIRLPDDIECPFRAAPGRLSRILMPVGETAVMPQ